MLARTGQLPTHGDYGFEVKWDGLRALIRTQGEFHVRSRRGWNMTPLVPEFAASVLRDYLDEHKIASRRSTGLVFGTSAERPFVPSGRPTTCTAT